MINTTIFKSAFILLVVQLSFAIALPVKADPEESEILSWKPTTGAPVPLIPTDHYDQRQNGSKNVRVHVDGLVFVVAPAEALFLGGFEPDLFSLGSENVGDSVKPEAAGSNNPKPSAAAARRPLKSKSAHSHPLRLSNLLGPLLRRITP